MLYFPCLYTKDGIVSFMKNTFTKIKCFMMFVLLIKVGNRNLQNSK